MLTFYDAAYPPASPPATDGVAFYIGGNALHIWTKVEIESQPARYRLPIFVRSNPASASMTVDVTAAVTQLHAVGAPSGCLVAWDTELAHDPTYILGVYRGLRTAGYELIVYGSQSVVGENQNPDGLYWGADWTNRTHVASGDMMTQWVSFNAWDLSTAENYLPFWDTHAPAPVPPPLSWQEKLVENLPVVTPGSTGNVVRTVQGLCVARGQSIAVDGVYGPGTAAAVKEVQTAAGLTPDGVTGPATWPALVAG